MRVRTYEACGVCDVLTRVEDTCEAFFSAAACVCVRYSHVLHVCMYTMLESEIEACFKGFCSFDSLYQMYHCMCIDSPLVGTKVRVNSETVGILPSWCL